MATINNKRQLLDPIGSICHIVSLTFKPLNTKIGINNHAIIIQESNLFQWLDRYWNGDNRENISLLYNIVIRVIEWYIIPLSDKYKTKINKDDMNETEREKFWICLEKMCTFLCLAFDRLQHTYYTGPIPTNVVTTIQYYIIKILWNGEKLKQICDLYEKCFEKLNSNEKTKEDQIAGYMQAVDKLLSIHDNQFRELINFSNEG